MEIRTFGKMPKFWVKLAFEKMPYLGQIVTDFEK